MPRYARHGGGRDPVKKPWRDEGGGTILSYLACRRGDNMWAYMGLVGVLACGGEGVYGHATSALSDTEMRRWEPM